MRQDLLIIASALALLPAQFSLGQTNSPRLVKDIAAGAGSSSPQYFFPFSQSVSLFVAQSAAGWELWRTDGTESGTYMVRDINPGPASGIYDSYRGFNSDPQFTWLGATVLFVATNSLGTELWRTDGTEAGTYRITDILPGANTQSFHYYYPTALTTLNTHVLFYAYDPTHGIELWKSDGTTAGTVLVRDIFPGQGHGPYVVTSPGLPVPQLITTWNGTALFAASNTETNQELWRSDGTAAGTSMVLELKAGPYGSNPNTFRLTDNGVVFLASGTNDNGLYRLFVTDGTSTGTVRLRADDPLLQTSSPIGRLIQVRNTVFFYIGGWEWITDGTDSGTLRLVEGEGYSLAPLGSEVLMSLSNSVVGTELWTTDGTPAGTHLVKDIRPGPLGSFPDVLTAAGGQVWFTADDGVHGRKLWRSDGTELGTVLADLAPQFPAIGTPWLRAAGPGLLFDAGGAGIGIELWAIDLCPADWNRTNGLTVQDLVDYLNDWFHGLPTTNWNGMNGVEVHDIFDYLAAWFAGCP